MLFDLDGTLVDTSGDIAFAINSALKAAGLPPAPKEQCMRHVGNGLRNTLLGMLSDYGVTVGPEEAGRLLQIVQDTYAGNPVKHSGLYGGIRRLLEKSVAGNLKLGVLSNKDDALVQAIVAHWFGDIPFIMVQGASRSVPLKPDPQAALSFATIAGCRPGEVVMIGDSEVDFRTAKASGMQPLIVTWGFRRKVDLAASGCAPLYDTAEEVETEVFPWE